MDPVNLYHPLLHRVADVIRDAVIQHPAFVEFRDLNLWHEDGRERGDVEVSVEPEIPQADYAALSEHLRTQVQHHFPSLTFNVRLKVDFTAEPLTA